jgi:hypothetical protein
MPSYDVSSTRRSIFSRIRTKVMARPSAVFELGIHHISRPLYSLDVARELQLQTRRPGPTVVVSVPPDEAFIHHYRSCTTSYDHDMDCYRKHFVDDDRLHAAGYLERLDERVRIMLAAVLG